MIIALAVLAIASGVLGWQLYVSSRALKRVRRECEGLKQDRVIRQNLQQMLDGRNAEIRKLRARLRNREEALADLEQQTSELNLNLFHESGLRILREKEESARRMKLELTERQLDEANRKLRQQKEEARADEVRMTAIIAEQQERIEKLTAQTEKTAAAQPRRSRKNPGGLPNQMTLEDVLGSRE